MLKSFFWLFLFCFSLQASAAEISYRLNNELFGATTYQKPAASPVNPGNRLLEIPASLTNLEYRPDLQITSGENLKLVVRSRWMLNYSSFNYELPDATRTLTKGDVDLSDAFLEDQITENTSAAIGLQNYQWGPAELYSPSNPFFHFNTAQKSFFYKEKGHVLVRVNSNFGTGLNVVAMYEPITNNAPYWAEARDFTPKSLVKAEYQFQNRSNYVALLGGSGELYRPFVGEYFNWSPSEGVSFYLDARHDQGHTNSRPERNPLGFIAMTAPEASDNQWQTLGLVGFRYEQGNYDFRQEFLYNSAGFSKDEWDQAKLAATTLSPVLITNLRRLAHPGLEFLSRQYSYTSVRIPDVGKKKDSNLYVRYLSNLQDHSGVFQLDADKNWNESVVLYAEGLMFHGSKGSEFRLSDDFQASIGFRKSF